MMTRSAQRKAKVDRRKAALWKQQHGLCYWCRKQMRHWRRWQHEQHAKTPDDLATIDHLRDRFDSSRTDPVRGRRDQRWVLAHAKCNHERGYKRQREQGIDALRLRSGRTSIA